MQYHQTKMIYWKSEKFWLGKLTEHPEIMSQGETIQELKENLKEACHLMCLKDAANHFPIRKIFTEVNPGKDSEDQV